MSVESKLFKEMLKMSSAAAQQASTNAPSHKLTCWTQPNPTNGSTQPMDNSETDGPLHCLMLPAVRTVA